MTEEQKFIRGKYLEPGFPEQREMGVMTDISFQDICNWQKINATQRRAHCLWGFSHPLEVEEADPREDENEAILKRLTQTTAGQDARRTAARHTLGNSNPSTKRSHCRNTSSCEQESVNQRVEKWVAQTQKALLQSVEAQRTSKPDRSFQRAEYNEADLDLPRRVSAPSMDHTGSREHGKLVTRFIRSKSENCTPVSGQGSWRFCYKPGTKTPPEIRGAAPSVVGIPCAGFKAKLQVILERLRRSGERNA